MLLSRRTTVLSTLLFCFTCTFSQTQCIDYDKASYPKVVSIYTFPWDAAHWNFTNLKQHKITGLSRTQFGNDFFKGLLEYLPANYNAGNTTIKHPIIIFFHGGASAGDGTATSLCYLFKDRGTDMATHLSIPGRVERSTSLFTQSYLGEAFQYIVVSPQFNKYIRAYNADGTPKPGNSFPSANEVEQVINYMVNVRYANKIDLRRIYLVGYSNGANMIMEYAGSSVARAKRVAAVMPVSLCSQLNHLSNTSVGIKASNIAQAKLKTWFVYCTVDNCGSGPALNVSQAWVSGIKSAGGQAPRLTMLTRAGNVGSHSEGLYNCSDTLAHDAWSRAFDPNFRASFTGNGANTNPNDGVNLNMYEWFTHQISAVLPVKLTAFSARLNTDKVDLRWTTADEKDNASFTIERAGTDQQFDSLTSIEGARTSTGDKDYYISDPHPLQGMSFYRLVQTDIDGEKTYFDIRKILNAPSGEAKIVIYPVPFNNEISILVAVKRPQKINVLLTDASGKILKSLSTFLSAGSSELHVPAGNLSSGVYFLKISGDEINETRKIVRQ